jgi:hypothetical protein
MQVTEPTPKQVEAFRNLAQPPVKACGEPGKELVADLFKAIEVNRKAR